MDCYCCQSAVKDALRGISLLTALGGLAAALLAAHGLVPLGATAQDPAVAWFGWLLLAYGAFLAILGTAAATGSWCSLTAPIHCLTGATLALLPLETLLVWAYTTHGTELRHVADRDQTYTAVRILDWADGHASLAGGLAGLWLLLQGATVLLGCVHACCPAARRHKHPWDRYWLGEDEREGPRAPLLPRDIRTTPPSWAPAEAPAASGNPSPSRSAGYHTPPSRSQSPFTSPSRLPTAGPASYPVTIT